MPPPVPALPDELLEEVFLRLPSDEPEFLVRASLASKLWLRILSGPRFHGRYREFHGAAPMLGFVYYPKHRGGEEVYFRPTTKFRARIPDSRGCGKDPWDCRHGRVLLQKSETNFLVWNPMSGCQRELDGPEDPAHNPVYPGYCSLGAAVLCAVTGCDHHACHQGPFQVVLVSVDNSHGGCVAYAHISLTQMGDGCKPSSALSPAGEWTKPCADLDLDLYLVGVRACIDIKPPVFIEEALYFVIKNDDNDVAIAILKCDLAANCLSLIDVPPLETDPGAESETILMAMEDGNLAFAQLDTSTLYLWSMQIGFDGVLSWTEHRVINLKVHLLIQNPKERLTLVGSLEGTDTIFVSTDLGIYGICLKSLSVKKLWKREMFHYLVPYMSFYHPREKVNPCSPTH